MKTPFRGFTAILLKEFTVVFRDRTTLFFMFFPPLIQIIAFGFALDNDVKHMATVVFNEDQSVESRQFIDSFVNTQTFRVVKEQGGALVRNETPCKTEGQNRWVEDFLGPGGCRRREGRGCHLARVSVPDVLDKTAARFLPHGPKFPV